eukprot:1179673-Prorocentrum_minimum.AAC.2
MNTRVCIFIRSSAADRFRDGAPGRGTRGGYLGVTCPPQIGADAVGVAVREHVLMLRLRDVVLSKYSVTHLVLGADAVGVAVREHVLMLRLRDVVAPPHREGSGGRRPALRPQPEHPQPRVQLVQSKLVGGGGASNRPRPPRVGGLLYHLRYRLRNINHP